ncbi:ArsC/Spx/MgsR family protein [Lactococcus petauri]|uniref:ArsC/Spx/MgsR family protein n=1 Tax=Lactococcus petauri TaxID=1940789 RepID=UPI0038542FEF
MITVYYGASCLSCRKVMAWLDSHSVPYRKQKIELITTQDLLRLLILSEEGMGELTKSYERSTESVKIKLRLLEEMNFNEGLRYLKMNVELLQTPLVISQKKYLVGYHSENIRQFAPRYYRISSTFLHRYIVRKK